MRRTALKISLGLMGGAIVALGFADYTAVSQTSSSAQKAEYPAPSYPELPKLETLEEIMPYARQLASNKNAFLGRGLGEISSGEKILIVTTTIDPKSDVYVQAALKALDERDVEVVLMRHYDILGVTLEQARALDGYLKEHVNRTSRHGWVEGCYMLDKEFLKSSRPDLFEQCNPPAVADNLPAELRSVYAKLYQPEHVTAKYLNDYMDKNPDIVGVFYGRAGPTWMSFHPHEDRWMGPFTFDNNWHASEPTVGFPADVWMLSEELTMEPLSSTDKVTVTDAEGTDVWWELTEDQAQRWARGVYLRGHLFMFPQEAYGQYALSVVNYPALDPEYIPVEDAVMLNGVIAVTSSHFGFLPRMEQVWEDGYLKEVRGGGTYGELLRTLMQQPGIHDITYPQRKKPGYFYHFETALGTNPKVVRHDLEKPWGILEERARDGVMHWGLGAIYWNDPGSMGGWSDQTGKLAEFGKENRVPPGHGFHLHTYFNTMKMRLRGSDRWVTVVDRGRSTSLDHPEVRALASRYGDPDKILATEWVPEVPGINAPGKYEDYAKDAYAHSLKIMKKVTSGDYDSYNPYVRPAKP